MVSSIRHSVVQYSCETSICFKDLFAVSHIVFILPSTSPTTFQPSLPVGALPPLRRPFTSHIQIYQLVSASPTMIVLGSAVDTVAWLTSGIGGNFPADFMPIHMTLCFSKLTRN